MAYNNNYNNTFGIDRFFNRNFDMPAYPSKPLIKKAWRPKGFILLLLLAIIWIPLAIINAIMNSKRKAAYSEACAAWSNALNIRKATWPGEYDKFLADIESKLTIKSDGMKKLDLQDEDLAKAVDKDGNTIEPFYIKGDMLKEGFWRSYSDGYRCSMRQYTHFFFTEDQVMIYMRQLNLLNLESKKESTLEFFYSDITSVSVSQVSIETKTGINDDGSDSKTEEIDTEKFQLVVPGDKMHFAYTASERTTANINNLRQRIRNAKNK